MPIDSNSGSGQKRTGQVADHAVVLGGGLAGLCTAAVLAERFASTTIVERDVLPQAPGHRKGVPQDRHNHVLLPLGVESLERIFPGVVEELRKGGAGLVDAPESLRIYMAGGAILVDRFDVTLVTATRPFLEAVVRSRVDSRGNVRFIEGREAAGLVTSPDRKRVNGVRVLPRGGSGAGEALAADLVVDATGRGSQAPRWLADLGYPAPAEDRVQVGVHYASRLFERKPGELGGALNVLVARPPGQRRGGVIAAVEGDRWSVTLSGFLGERPPDELDAFIEYARSLWRPEIYDVVSRARPIGEGATGSYPANLWRRYDRLDRFPERFVVTGDAVSPLNPTYAQGMSVAIAEALVLAATLDQGGLDRVGPRFFKRSMALVKNSWTQATDSDLRDPNVEGPRTPRWRILKAYGDRLVPLTHRDPVVGGAFLRVIGLAAPPPTLMHPRILGRVLLSRLRPGARARRAPHPSSQTAAAKDGR